jgi:hypothetical protein
LSDDGGCECAWGWGEMGRLVNAGMAAAFAYVIVTSKECCNFTYTTLAFLFSQSSQHLLHK